MGVANRTLIVGDRLGRLWWGRIMCFLWLFGILVYTTSAGNIEQVYGGKFVVGVGLGQMSVIAPAYIAVSEALMMSLWMQRYETDFIHQGMCACPEQRYVHQLLTNHTVWT